MTKSPYEERKWYDASVSGPLTGEAFEEFLAGTWLAKLSVIKPDGWPYVVPLWYQWQDRALWLVGRKRSEWVQDLVREPRCAICIEEKDIPPAGGNRKILAQCTAGGRRGAGRGRGVGVGRDRQPDGASLRGP